MPIRTTDPFHDPTEGLNPTVNPFLAEMTKAHAEGSLPISYGPALGRFPGAWRNILAEKMGREPEALILEIGCHYGESLQAMASDFPHYGFIGIDITFKRVVKTARKARTHGLNNVLSVLANANGLGQLFSDGELDGVAIFYPDPWNKKTRQRKNQLLQPAFCQTLADKTRAGGFTWIKMDQFSYYASTIAALEQSGFSKASAAQHPLTRQGVSTCFERHFQEAGMSTFSGVWVKTLN